METRQIHDFIYPELEGWLEDKAEDELLVPDWNETRMLRIIQAVAEALEWTKCSSNVKFTTHSLRHGSAELGEATHGDANLFTGHSRRSWCARFYARSNAEKGTKRSRLVKRVETAAEEGRSQRREAAAPKQAAPKKAAAGGKQIRRKRSAVEPGA